MPHKILVTGTLRAGKTTLMTALEGRRDITVVREVAQDFIDQYGYEVTQRPEFQDMVFAEQLRREDEAMKLGRDYVLCDRGTVDILGFCEIIGHPVKPEWAASILGRYDGVTIFHKDDINFDTSEYPEEMRPKMVAYRAAVDQSIRQVLENYGLKPLEIQGTHPERLALFETYLQQVALREGTRLNQEGRFYGRRGLERG